MVKEPATPISWLKDVLEDLRQKASLLPPDKFYELLDGLVESSRNHIESSEDEQIRINLIELYKSIISYAMACQLRARSCRDPGYMQSSMSASC